jgi:uncharacterized protein (TIGR03435 family)
MLMASDAAFCQTTTARAFDVASVRPNSSAVNEGSISRDGGRLTATNFSLRDLIAFAYSIPTGRDYELSGPAWLEDRKFDIAATLPPETSRDGLREMLRTLLNERFYLKTHTETRKLNSYALMVAKNGPKLPVTSTTSDGAFVFGDDHISASGFSMAGLANRLSGPVFKLDRPVVDLTGIKGTFDFMLNWSPDGIATTEGHPGASIFTALQEQLGLKLVARRLAFKIVVIDPADKEPAGN